ncbi:MAG: cytochrome c [Gemmatimonadales bacterium]|jgi:mono/diheme cytochrome c family protein
MRTTVLIAFAAAVSLTGCGGDKASGGAVQTASATPAPAATVASAPDGRQVYQRCAVCHQAAGQGVPGTFPPLALSEWATAASAALPIRVVLHGLQGPVTVKGQKFNGTMPAFGTGQPMNDADVAAVLTYVRSSWGNKAGAVSADSVAKERTATASQSAPWTAAQLAPLLGAGGH